VCSPTAGVALRAENSGGADRGMGSGGISLVGEAEGIAADVGAVDYLTQLQRHAAELAWNPSPWLPWNHRATLPQSGIGVDSG
jgi:hypothetical protein